MSTSRPGEGHLEVHVEPGGAGPAGSEEIGEVVEGQRESGGRVQPPEVAGGVRGLVRDGLCGMQAHKKDYVRRECNVS